MVQMTRRSFLKRSAALGGALILPEILVPERRFWQGVTLASHTAVNAATGESAIVTIIGPAVPGEFTAIHSEPPMVSRYHAHRNGRGNITEPYDIIWLDTELMMVVGFTESGVPLVARNIGGQFSEPPHPLYRSKVLR